MFRWTSKYEKNTQGKFKNKVRANFFTCVFKYSRINLNIKETTAMAKGTKETKEQSEAKKPQAKSEKKSSCGCGCIPPMKTK